MRVLKWGHMVRRATLLITCMSSVCFQSCVHNRGATQLIDASVTSTELIRSREVISSLHNINKIVVDSSGRRVLVATDGGVIEWRESVSPSAVWTASGGMCGNSVTAIAVIGEQTWIGTRDAGICARDVNGRWAANAASTFLVHSRSEAITSMTLDSAGRMWMSTSLGSLWSSSRIGEWSLKIDGSDFDEVGIVDVEAVGENVMLVRSDGSVGSVGVDSGTVEFATGPISLSGDDLENRDFQLVKSMEEHLLFSDGQEVYMIGSDARGRRVEVPSMRSAVIARGHAGGWIVCGLVTGSLTCLDISEQLDVQEIWHDAIGDVYDVAAVADYFGTDIIIGVDQGRILHLNRANGRVDGDRYRNPLGSLPNVRVGLVGIANDGFMAVWGRDAAERQWLWLRDGNGKWSSEEVPEHLILGSEGIGTAMTLAPAKLAVDDSHVVWMARGEDVLRVERGRWDRIRAPDGSWLEGAHDLEVSGMGDVAVGTGDGVLLIERGQQVGAMVFASDGCANVVYDVELLDEESWLLATSCGLWKLVSSTGIESVVFESETCAESTRFALSSVAVQGAKRWWSIDYADRLVMIALDKGRCEVVLRVRGEEIDGVLEMSSDSVGGMWVLAYVMVGEDERFSPNSRVRIMHWDADGEVESLPAERGAGGTGISSLAWDARLDSLWVANWVGGLSRLTAGVGDLSSSAFFPQAVR